jgi:hypothetical protein
LYAWQEPEWRRVATDVLGAGVCVYAVVAVPVPVAVPVDVAVPASPLSALISYFVCSAVSAGAAPALSVAAVPACVPLPVVVGVAAADSSVSSLARRRPALICC